MKALEQRANEAGLPYLAMMEHAGRAVAEFLIAQGYRTAAIFCGKGNNGGDGFVIARLLKAKGVSVCVYLVEGTPVTQDAFHNYCRLDRSVFSPLENVEVAVDAIYGTGFRGELRPHAVQAIKTMQTCKHIVAVDVPSGVNADTGACAQGAVKANVTVTFHATKPCHRLAKQQCGKILLRDIGIETVI